MKPKARNPNPTSSSLKKLMANHQQEISGQLKRYSELICGALAPGETPGLYGNDGEMERYRVRFHHFHVTQRKGIDGKLFDSWRYAIVDFSECRVDKQLVSYAHWTPEDVVGSRDSGVIARGLPGLNRFTLIIKSKHEHEEQIEIYCVPDTDYIRTAAGVATLRTEGRTARIIAPCFLSSVPFRTIPENKVGFLTQKQAEEVESAWRMAMDAANVKIHPLLRAG